MGRHSSDADTSWLRRVRLERPVEPVVESRGITLRARAPPHVSSDIAWTRARRARGTAQRLRRCHPESLARVMSVAIGFRSIPTAAAALPHRFNERRAAPAEGIEHVPGISTSRKRVAGMSPMNFAG